MNDLKLPLALGRKIGCLIWFDSLNYHAKWEILVVKDEHSSLSQDLRSLQRLRLLRPPGDGSLSKQLAHGKSLQIQTQIPAALCNQNNTRHGLGAHPGAVQPGEGWVTPGEGWDTHAPGHRGLTARAAHGGSAR